MIPECGGGSVAPSLGRGRSSGRSKMKPPRSPAGKGGGKASGSNTQLLRNPSAERFHCVTLSEIIRVDFIAAWLSWA